MNPGLTLVCFAMPEEARPFRREAPNSCHVIVTGMGETNTRRAVMPLLESLKPGRVLTCGFAGGLNPALGLNAVLFETTDADLPLRLRAAGAQEGQFHCQGRIAVTVAEKTALRQATAADAVEMESAVIHELCRERGIPCATVRVISDVATENFPLDFNALTTADQRLHVGKLMVALLCAPWKVPSLMRLQRQTHAAAVKLAEVLVRVLTFEAHTPPSVRNEKIM